MKVYVAGAWVEQHWRARPMIARLREAGHVITCDWTQAEGNVCACGHHRSEHGTIKGRACSGSEMIAGGAIALSCMCSAFNGLGVSGGDAALSPEDRRKYAQADVDGVLAADVVWLLAANTQNACGSWVEFGVALGVCEHANTMSKIGVALGPTIVVSGLKNRRTIFTELAHRLFDTDEEAFAWITEAR